LTLRRQIFHIFFGKKYKTALVPATSRTALAGEPEPVSIKRLFVSHKVNFYPKTQGFTSPILIIEDTDSSIGDSFSVQSVVTLFTTP
jgi:hypothetical protein